MAALAHASILLNFFIPGLGIIAAAAVWLTQRERSAYAAFQALQAAVLQLVLTLAPIVFGAGAVLAAVSSLAFSRSGEGMLVLLIPLVIIGGILILTILFLGLLYALVAAYETYQGRDFRYWLIGKMVTRR